MNSSDPERRPLDNDEREEFAQLPREIAPDAALEHRVVRAVRDRRAGPPRFAPRWMRIAAVAAIFAAGFFAAHAATFLTSRRTASSGEPSRYLLLLYDGRRSAPGASEEAARAAEYSAWAARERRAGVVEMGERLDDSALPLGAAILPGAQPTGFFLIRASSMDDALAVGRRCPHLSHGGSIVVRPIWR